MPQTLIGTAELAAMLGGISRMTISRWRAAGVLPRPAYVSPDGHVVLWSRAAITDWLRAGGGPADPELHRAAMAACGGAKSREWHQARRAASAAEDDRNPELLQKLETLLAESPLVGQPAEGEELATLDTYPARLQAAAAELLAALQALRITT